MDFITHNIDLTAGDPHEKRAEIKRYFNTTWELYERLFEVLASDDVFYRRPQPLRHPLLFYFGHTAVFYVNKLILARQLEHRVDPQLESLFAIGVDEMSWDDLNDAHYDWPGVDAARQYRNNVRAAVNGLIDTAELTLPIRRTMSGGSS